MAKKQLIQDPEAIQLDEFNEINQILGDPPQWLLKWGILLVFVVFGIFLTLGSWVQYPDKVIAQAILTTELPPVRLFSKIQDRVEELLVENGEAVKKGQLLAVLNSDVNRYDLNRLENTLTQIHSDQSFGSLLALPDSLQLGDLQIQYQEIKRLIGNFQFYKNQGDVLQKIKLINEQLTHLRDLNLAIENQIKTLEQEVQLKLDNFQRYQKLAIERIKSEEDLQEVETEYLQTKRQLDQLKTGQFENQVTIDRLKLQIVELKSIDSTRSTEQNNAIATQIAQLLNAIKQWRHQYLIIASVEGQVVLTNLEQPNQFVNAGEELMVINPIQRNNKVVAKAFLQSQSSGKVKMGQTVYIRLAGFPYQEFGELFGEIVTINIVPEMRENAPMYQVEIDLPNGLITTTNRTVGFKQEMTGEAQIITERSSFLARILKRLRYLWSRQEDLSASNLELPGNGR